MLGRWVHVWRDVRSERRVVRSADAKALERTRVKKRRRYEGYERY